MKNILIIGAGPAGLTAAYELLKTSTDYHITILESSNDIGGISKTITYKGNRMDIGGHRFFSKIKKVNNWWTSFLPEQGSPAVDYKKLNIKCKVNKNGPDPDTENLVMLNRNRLSRIFFNNKFFDYPINLKIKTIKNLGFKTSFVAGFSYLKSAIIKRRENSLEDFYINRFGKKLYSLFFENYTKNLWGKHPKDISPKWGAQRVQGISLFSLIKNILTSPFKNNSGKDASLIENFWYPKFGPGQLWHRVANKIKKMGGKILLDSEVVSINKDLNNINYVEYRLNGKKMTMEADVVISSMPLKDLVNALNDVPSQIHKIANGLPYRDYITIGLLLKNMKIKNETNIPTISNIIPDDWIYIHDSKTLMCRMQIYNNWSPYLVKDIKNTIWIGAEYFCTENDEIWNMGNDNLAKMCINEIQNLGFINDENDVIDWHIERIKKAYPAYFGTYNDINLLIDYLNKITNLYCIGRNGQHKYNNMDHSMCSAFEAVDNIINSKKSKENIWHTKYDELIR